MYVTRLSCPQCSNTYESEVLIQVCDCGSPLLVEYDLDQVSAVMNKALKELQQMGWIGEKMPRLVAVQSTGCAPIVKAWEEGKKESVFWEGAHTLAFGITVPKALGDFLVLDAIITRCQNGYDHDVDPLGFHLDYLDRDFDLRFYSRLREINEESSFSVLG